MEKKKKKKTTTNSTSTDRRSDRRKLRLQTGSEIGNDGQQDPFTHSPTTGSTHIFLYLKDVKIFKLNYSEVTAAVKRTQ